MPMKVSTYRGEVCGERLGLFEKIHGALGRVVERARSFWDTTLGCSPKETKISLSKRSFAVQAKYRLSERSIAASQGEFQVPDHEGTN